MNFELSMEEFTIIQNALHYYKNVEKRGHFAKYDIERINQLRDKLSYQMIPSINSKDGTVPSPLEDVNDVTWSIVVLLITLLIGVSYCIVYIMTVAFKELEDGSNDATESEELLQLPSDRDNKKSLTEIQ